MPIILIKKAYLNSDLNVLQITAHEEQITITYYNRKQRTNIQIIQKWLFFLLTFSLFFIQHNSKYRLKYTCNTLSIITSSHIFNRRRRSAAKKTSRTADYFLLEFLADGGSGWRGPPASKTKRTNHPTYIYNI